MYLDLFTSISETDSEFIPLQIEGFSGSSHGLRTFPIYNFEQQRIVHWAESADCSAANLAADVALTAFEIWKNFSALSRREILLRYASLLAQNEEELVGCQQLEIGISNMTARKNMQAAVNLVEEAAYCVASLQGDLPQTQTPGCVTITQVTPVGPVLSIAPGSESILLGTQALAMPVTAGCTVVFKASGLCPKTHGLLAALFVEAGLPLGVISVLQTRPEDDDEVTETLISHMGIRKIEFIGSARSGKIIGQMAAKYLKPISMELGGKSPIIVLADADLNDATSNRLAGALLGCDRLGIATETVIMIRSIAARFEEIIRASETGGDSVSESVCGSTIIKPLKLVTDTRHSYEVQPSILPSSIGHPSNAGSYSSSAYYHLVEDDMEAIRIANQTCWSSKAAIYSADLEHALAVAQELDVCEVSINSMIADCVDTVRWNIGKNVGRGQNDTFCGLKRFTKTKMINFSPKKSQMFV